MTNGKNFLLGYGERLIQRIPPPAMKPDKAHPYTFTEARDRLSRKAATVVADVEALPSITCPGDEAVALMTIHPAYLAKSHYPSSLLSQAGLRAIGSRPRSIAPDKWAASEHPNAAVTSEIYVAAKRSQFRRLRDILPTLPEGVTGALDIRKIEDFRVAISRQMIPPLDGADTTILLEVVIHASALPESLYVLDGFRIFMDSLGVRVDMGKRRHAGGLCFLPLHAPRGLVQQIATFSFLRTVREMPKLRAFRPDESVSLTGTFNAVLPTNKGPTQDVRVPIFDGGVPKDHGLEQWLNVVRPHNVGEPSAEQMRHGMSVSSAVLFGPLVRDLAVDTPHVTVDHYQVVDSTTDPQGDLFDVLDRITNVLKTRRYEFINLSIGPDLPVEDDEVHVWTAILDEHLSTGNVLATVAAGNKGHYDRSSGNARIQPPADAVNALTVGSCDQEFGGWSRVEHSSVGPGRSPGRVKPDGVAFGGAPRNPYFVVSRGKSSATVPTMGTSVAAPTALRIAAGVRAYMGPVLRPIAIKALLIHRADDNAGQRMETGWGRFSNDVDSLVTSMPGEVHVVYQGELAPAEWIRAPVPVPKISITRGKVEVEATLCFSTPTDPQDPFHYTRSGLEVKFRPDAGDRETDEQMNAATESFFSQKRMYASEVDLRRDGHKWETAIRGKRGFLWASLNEPVFDIHYNAREGGHDARAAKSIQYALIVTVRSRKIADLYDRILYRYRTYLEPIRPLVEIPVRVSKG